MASSLLVLAAATLTLGLVQGQADMNSSTTFWKLSFDQKVLNIAQFLAGNIDTTKQLLEIAKSLRWLEQGTNGQLPGDAILPMVLDALPGVLGSNYIKGAVFLVLDEINRTRVDNVTQEVLFNATIDKIKPYNAPVYSQLFNDTLLKLTMLYKANNFNLIRAVNRYINQISARDLLFETSANLTVNPQCYSDTMDFFDAVVGARVNNDPNNVDLEHYFWAFKMLDSFGKPSGGIMKGAVHFVGSFDECGEVQAYLPNNSSFMFGQHPHNYTTRYDTRFCRVTFDLPDSVSESFNVDTRGITLRLNWGMCFPDSCHSDDVAAMFHLGKLQPYNISVHNVFCGEEDDLEDDPSAIVALFLLATLLGVVVLCTLLEAAVIFYNNNFAPSASSTNSTIEDPDNETHSIEKETVYVNQAFEPDSDKESVPKLVKAFSLLTNMPKVLSGSKSPKAIHCLHGIRFFSLMWVVLGHTYNYGVISVVDNPTTVNLVDADAIFHRFTFQGIMAAGFAVDTFFLLSGLLVTWLSLRDMAKKNGVGYWVMFYFHRFWRLTPIYMIVLMTFTCLHTYLGGGPLWPEELGTATNCKKYWWTNFLYVNNLVHDDEACMGWTWYLANDMQFYWITPVFILALFYVAPLGLAMVIGLLAVGIVCAAYYEYDNGGDIFTMHESDSKYWDQVYIVPWCRVGAYAVGMLLGYIFHKVKQTTLNMSTAVIGWLVTWGVGLTLCYITYTERKTGAEEWDRWIETLYESVGRPLWAACVAWIIFACHNNRGGFINSILSWEGFLPLSRLTYAAYLVHPIVMMLHAYSKRALYYIDDFDMVYLFLGHSAVTYFTAFLFSLVAEAPALAVEKLVFRLH
ncbi:hypothetical protein V1264_007855 [Littorina saxatilis]|uniref:Nose resistant-to-fluoxetine protein N-terminal domain-containing protein n=1 Tax=Littorina saxatilis TaxID=31220 RepID=A0AAN9G481_9CAEN